MDNIKKQIGENLFKEDGGEFGFVLLWREGSDETIKWMGTVGEFLDIKENQNGTWLIDGGWGGPPGPIHVRYNETTSEWEHGGFLGYNFNT